MTTPRFEKEAEEINEKIDQEVWGDYDRKNVINLISTALARAYQEGVKDSAKVAESLNNCQHCWADCREEPCTCGIYKEISNNIKELLK